MKISINEKVLSENNLTLNEYLILLFNTRGGDMHQCISSLIEKGWANRDLFDDTKIVLSDNNRTRVLDVMLDSDKLVESKQDEFNDLANKLREIFPEGRKPGTTYSWRGSTIEVARKLKNLVVKYGCEFTANEAIEATKAYVEHWKNDPKYMKLLKYFILKTPRNNDGDVEVQSDLMAYIQNKNMTDPQQPDNWAIDLV